MESIYFVIVGFLLLLAVFDLFVGVSNDAVNFLTSAVGAKVSRWRTILFVAALGILCGALMSSGMMDVARHGVMHPENFSFHDVMVIFLAVMVSDVLILDIFNTLGLPTSTTVSLVFELLGATFLLSLVKITSDPSLSLDMLLNGDRALQMIIAIFVSVGIAFVCGVVVQYVARLVFTFSFTRHLRYTIALFGGLSITFLAYFIFIKGISSSPFIAGDTRQWIATHTQGLLVAIFAVATVLAEGLHLLRVNVFKIVILLGTFALAMAFAGNDLVNFIGVPLAGLSALQDFTSHGTDATTTSFMMRSLCASATSPFLYLFLAGVVMIVAITTSKKARNVVRTSVDLSRQDEGDEMFGSSRVARSIVRFTENCGSVCTRLTPSFLCRWVNNRFNKSDAVLAEGAAFDVVRAAVNLVLSAALIILGTLYKLPLSTTYVTFMVAMGSSLADRAWAKESAVFRVTGVLSVIGGWFVTAGAAFLTCALICLLMYFGGFVVMTAFIALVLFLLVRSNIRYARKAREERTDELFTLMMRCKEPEIVLDLLNKHVVTTQSTLMAFVREQYNNILTGFHSENLRLLRHTMRELDDKRAQLKKVRRREYLALKRTPRTVALERNTWFHLGANSNAQAIYCLRRMLEPILEHVENSFMTLPDEYVAQYESIRRMVDDLLQEAEEMLATRRYDRYRHLRDSAQGVKHALSQLRDKHLDTMHDLPSNEAYNVSVVYLNLLQETRELLSVVRHILRAANKFLDNEPLIA